MLGLFLKLIFWIVSTISNLITHLIFSATAHAVVLLIHTFKVPGEAAQDALEQLGEVIKACCQYMAELIVELTTSLISSAFDVLIQVVTSSASVSGEIFGTVVEKTRTSLQELLTDLPEIAEGFSEMISTIVRDLWNNYNDALSYVTENA